MSEKQYFFREWAVTIGDSATSGEGKRFTDLKVVFDIEKTSESAPNKGKIDIYNLNSTTRQEFQKKGLFIRLDAGYRDLMETLFIGDVRKGNFKRSGPDIIGTFEAGDGERALVNAAFIRGYGAGVSVGQIISDIARELGVTVGSILGIQKETYNSGITFSRSAKSALDQLTAKQNLEWSIQNNTLQILPKTAHLGEEAILLNKNTGLIGVPSVENGDSLKCISLLNPQIQPGRLLQIESTTVNGSYKTRKCKFEGDTHGDKWQVSIEAVKINATQVVNTGFQ